MSEAARPQHRHPIGWDLLLTVVAFGLTPVFQKLAIVDGTAPWTVAIGTALFAVAASTLAGLLLQPGLLVCLVRREHWLPLALLGVLATGLVTLLVVQALTVTTATNRSLFQSAYPAATLVLAHWLLGERLRAGQYVAVTVLMGGLLLMNLDAEGVRFGFGFWLLLATLPLIGVGDVYSKHLTERLSPLVLAGGRNLYGALFLLLVAPLLGIEMPQQAWQWLWLGCGGILQGLGVWTLYRAMRGGKASLVAAVVGAAPLLTLGAESLLLPLSLSPVQWAGLLLVPLAAGWLAYSQMPR